MSRAANHLAEGDPPHGNSFGRHLCPPVDATGRGRTPGANELQVAFTCAQCYGQTKAAQFPVPLHEFRANRYSYGGRPFIRKSQTHFGWNWGPGCARAPSLMTSLVTS